MRSGLMFALMGALLAASPVLGAQPWIDASQYGALEIVVATEAAPDTLDAAHEFQIYWEKVTGEEIPIVHEPSGGIPVWIGKDIAPAALLGKVKLKGLRDDGICIRTFKAGKDTPPQLLLVGGAPLGDLFAVYEFFDRFMGVKWLAPYVTHIPEAPEAIPAINYRHVPPFELRSTTYGWWLGQKDSALYQRYKKIWRHNDGPSFACHSLFRQVPPATYFADHPEYYSLLNGERKAPLNWWDLENVKEDEKSQLCFSNPDVVRLLYDAVKADIARDPSNKYVHISQMDWVGNCECDNCRAIDEREGTPMGSVLTALNQIADWMAVDYPDYRLETLAYWYTRQPPKHLRPRDNVVIKLCSIECDFARPLNDRSSELNKEFVHDIKTWSRVADRLHIWDYTPNYTHPDIPHPNFHVLKPNMLFFLKHKTKGMFEQGLELQQSEFEELRTYMINKLMWDPYADDRAIRDEFIDLFYGKAAPYIKQYIDLMTECALSSDQPMGCFDDGKWLNYETIVKADVILKQALSAAECDEVRARVDRVYLSLEFASMLCPPRCEMTDTTLIVERPVLTTYDAFLARTQEIGARMIEGGFYDPEKHARGLLHGLTPAKRLESTIEKLERNGTEVWLTPGIFGSVIRWRHASSGLELLQAYEQIELNFGAWQEWVNTPGEFEYPVVTSYEVVQRTQNAITLTGKTAEGVEVTKRISLTENGDVAFEMILANNTDHALPGNFKVHPEFYTQGVYTARFFGEKTDGSWEALNPYVQEGATAWGRWLEASPYTRLAFHVDEKDFGVVVDYDPAQVANLVCFLAVDPVRQHANLELLPPAGDLQSGEKRTIQGSYRVFEGEPESLGDK